MQIPGRILILLIFIFSCTKPLYALDLTALNLFYHIFPYSEVKIDYQISSKKDSLMLDYQVTLSAALDFKDVEIRLLSQPEYTSKAHKELQNLSSIDTVMSAQKMRFFSASIPLAYVDSLLILEVYDLKNNFGYVYDIPILSNENYPLPQLRVLKEEAPFLKSFALPNDSLFIEGAPEAFGYYYSYEFPAASPPMGNVSRNTTDRFQIDSSFHAKDNLNITLDKPGLYLLQKDSASFAGKPVRIQGYGFPEYRTIPDLIECTKYITTSAEYKDLLRQPEKANFDAKWLDMAGTSTRAKSLIRRYYQRVEEANMFFTSYKEGWKTDQGMIYIIFGTPDELRKGKNYEQWFYQKTPTRAEVTFNFIKVKDLFSRSHYRLLRDEKYAGIWFRTVEQWRTGR